MSKFSISNIAAEIVSSDGPISSKLLRRFCTGLLTRVVSGAVTPFDILLTAVVAVDILSLGLCRVDFVVDVGGAARPAELGPLGVSTTRWAGIGEGFNPGVLPMGLGPPVLPDRLLVDI